MLEIELAFLPLEESEGLEKVMEVTEGVMRAVIDHSLKVNREEIEFFNEKEPGLLEMLESISTGSTFPRVTYEEAMQSVVAHSEKYPDAFVFKPKMGGTLATEHEKYLAEEVYKGPVFIINYPSNQKPFYMLPNFQAPEEIPTSACFDLLIPRLGELAGGSLREHREKELLTMMKERGIKEEDYQWYIELRKYGSTRHGGFGMGWERLVSFITGLGNVRECIPFPRASEGSRF